MEDQNAPLSPRPQLPASDHSKPRRRRTNPLFWILGISALLFFAFVVFSGTMLLNGTGTKAMVGTGVMAAKDRVGVIELSGIILDSKKVIKQLEEFEENKGVKAVVLRLNSPGGAVAPSQEIYEAVKAYTKPLVVSMGSLAASGAYYIAAGSKRVYANPGTITGSIGVIMQFTNLEKLYEWAKITRYSIKTGKFKDSGADYRQMTPEERGLLQGMVDDTLSQFKKAIQQGRQLTAAEVDAVADGRIFSGTQAKQLKLVDELGTLRDAINDVAKQAKIEGKPKIVYPERSRRNLLEWVLNSDSEESESESFSRGAEMSGLVQLIQRVLSLPRPTVQLEPGVYWLLPWGA